MAGKYVHIVKHANLGFAKKNKNRKETHLVNKNSKKSFGMLGMLCLNTNTKFYLKSVFTKQSTTLAMNSY